MDSIWKVWLNRHSAVLRWSSLVAALLGFLLLAHSLPLEAGLEWFEAWIESLGPWGPASFAMIYIVAVLVFLPGSVLSLFAGAIFGFGLGVVIVSIASTTGAALAFLIARHTARDRITRQFRRYRKFEALDRAVSEGGWKVVALLRLSPLFPFHIQNYFYGVTSIRFWPCVLTSWLAMLPGTLKVVYVGSLAAAGLEALDEVAAPVDAWTWTLRGLGLLATIVATWYVVRVARRALAEEAELLEAEPTPEANSEGPAAEAAAGRPWATVAGMGTAALIVSAGVWAAANQDWLQHAVEDRLPPPPTASS